MPSAVAAASNAPVLAAMHNTWVTDKQEDVSGREICMLCRMYIMCSCILLLLYFLLVLLCAWCMRMHTKKVSKHIKSG